jgi:hypothetical protein
MTAASTSRLDQLHDMYVLRTIGRGWEPSERKAVVQWFTKVQDERWKGGASFIGFVQNMWNDFSKVLTPEELAAANETLTSLQPQFSSTGTLVRPGNDVAAFSEQELTEYLLWDPMAYTGDAKRGMASYEKGSCVTCHRFGDIGQSTGRIANGLDGLADARGTAQRDVPARDFRPLRVPGEPARALTRTSHRK